MKSKSKLTGEKKKTVTIFKLHYPITELQFLKLSILMQHFCSILICFSNLKWLKYFNSHNLRGIK